MKQLGLALAAVLVVALALVGFVYAFGVPQQAGVAASAGTPAVAQSSGSDGAAASVGPDPGTSAQAPGSPQAGTEVPPADPSSPLAIEIPGGVCHSDDPKLVKQHASYRMNQCAGCHLGGVPTGQ